MVITHKLISYQYFMDDATLFEIDMLMGMIPYADKVSYEQMRLIMWSNFKSTGCKVAKPDKMLPFYTDEEIEIEDYNKEQLDYMSEQIKNMFTNLNGKQS